MTPEEALTEARRRKTDRKKYQPAEALAQAKALEREERSERDGTRTFTVESSDNLYGRQVIRYSDSGDSD